MVFLLILLFSFSPQLYFSQSNEIEGSKPITISNGALVISADENFNEKISDNGIEKNATLTETNNGEVVVQNIYKSKIAYQTVKYAGNATKVVLPKKMINRVVKSIPSQYKNQNKDIAENDFVYPINQNETKFYTFQTLSYQAVGSGNYNFAISSDTFRFFKTKQITFFRINSILISEIQYYYKNRQITRPPPKMFFS